MSRFAALVIAAIAVGGCNHDALSPGGGDGEVGGSDLSGRADQGAGVDAGGADLRRDGGAPSPDDFARLCTLAASCGARLVPAATISASQCTSTLYDAWPDDPVTAHFVSCAGAGDCAALFACLGSDLLLLKKFSPNSQCQGNSIVREGHHYDCGAVGLTCVKELIGERAYCAKKACGEMFTMTCKGDTIERCSDNVFDTIDCARSGATCSQGQCVGAGAVCDSLHTPASCAGPVLTTCLNGRLAKQDCSREPLRTQCNGGQCGYPQGNIDCLIGNAMCMGTSAVICAGPGGGTWRAIDCRTLGFQTCGHPANSSEVICQ